MCVCVCVCAKEQTQCYFSDFSASPRDVPVFNSPIHYACLKNKQNPVNLKCTQTVQSLRYHICHFPSVAPLENSELTILTTLSTTPIIPKAVLTH